MMTAMKTRYIILALAITSLIPAIAQDNADQIQRDMVLEKEYDPQIENAGKIWTMPGVESFKPQKTDIVFSTSENLLHLSNGASTLSAIDGVVQLPDQYQKGYLRLGGGNHLHFIGDGQFNLLRTDNQWLDISIKHRSEQRGTQNKKWDSDNRISVNYAANTERLSFLVSLSEEFCNWHYYGSPNAVTPSIYGSTLQIPDAQWFSNTGLHFQMASRPNGKNVDFGVSIDENWFVLNQVYGVNAAGNGPKELDSDVKAFIIAHISKDWQARLNVRGRYLYTSNAPSEHASGNLYPDLPGNNFWFEAVPQVGYKWHLWSFFAGARFSKMSGDGYKFRIAPEISASTPLWENASLQIVVNGGEKAFSFAEGFRENLYIDPTIRLLPEYTPIHVGGKLIWRPVEMLQVVPYAGYRLVKDMAQFYNSSIYTDNGLPVLSFNETNLSFASLYANANQIYAGMEATLNWCDKVSAMADFRYNYWKASSVSSSGINSDQASYYLKNLDDVLSANGGKVWYKPSIELNTRIDVNAVRNLTLSLTYQMQLERYGAVSSSDAAAIRPSTANLAFARLDDIHLLNAEASYRITRNIGIFIQADNLLNRTSAWWNRYDLNGITIVAGASLTF